MSLFLGTDRFSGKVSLVEGLGCQVHVQGISLGLRFRVVLCNCKGSIGRWPILSDSSHENARLNLVSLVANNEVLASKP